MDSKLKAAFRYHMQAAQDRAKLTDGRKTYFAKLQRDLDALAKGKAARALAEARADVAANITRYPAPVRSIHRASESDGLRYVGRVIPDTPRGIWDSRGDCGWHTDPCGDVFKDGSGLCFGVVYQLPGRDGESRFVAGYEFGGCDGGPTLDLTAIYTESRHDYDTSPCDLDAAKDAARHADSMAKAAAESEREYQTAWRAGSDFAALGESIQSDKKELKALLSERKGAIRGMELDSGYAQEVPSICRMIKREASRLVASIASARKERAALASGDSPDLYFWPGDKRLQAAFCEGANLDAMPN